MAPQKIPSMRHKTRPAARLAAFREDTGLVALRYEQTKQAEPPIPIPPRNPLRMTRPQFTVSSGIPIVVAAPPVPPPQEEHPLFRTQRSHYAHADDWRRDSGLAPTSSSVTIREEGDDVLVYEKILDDVSDAPSVYSVDEQQTSGPASPTIEEANASLRPAPLRLSTCPPPRPATPQQTETEPPSESTHTQPPPQHSQSPSRTSSFTQKIGKSFSLRSVSSLGAKRLRKKTLGDDDKVTSPDAPPATMRGSPNPPDSPKSAARSLTGRGRRSVSPQPTIDTEFMPITTPIPEDSLWDDFSNLSFSKRGSIMFGGRADMLAASSMAKSEDPVASPAPAPEYTGVMPGGDATEEGPRASTKEESPSIPSIRVVSMDVERESQKVRSLYDSGDGLNWQDGGRVSSGERLEPTEEVPSDEEENVVSSPLSSPANPPSGDQPTTSHTLAIATPRSASSLSPRDSQIKGEYERAGGLEDWEDVEGADVDRYGFIKQRRPGSRSETPELKSVQFSPRKRNVLVKRPGSAYSSSPGGLRPPSRKVSARSLNTFTSELSTASRRSTRSSIRSATNRLPHNRDRRWMDEAGEMLALQPGLSDIAEEKKTGKVADASKRKEAGRSEKWRKMAKVVSKGKAGEGMEFEFDNKNQKLVERTWKGIPDCWRSAAWFSFLASSAKAWRCTDTEQHLMAEFRRLQEVASPDDVQIDLDVPRTVNGHVMFRKRYRGGQRLLFRVLHAISLYFPETGYVQGMASLAATLLCYYDEERCFVMLVRLWKYRGLQRLYQPGFAGLMSALQDFEQRWLGGKDVASKLTELAIDPTAYGTRWYLTLFNLSIPFPAQLRVWDVFMLLGECPPEGSSLTIPPNTATSSQAAAAAIAAKESGSATTPDDTTNPRGLDILHATSAALMDALREVLLDSDFENAMKALTAWIPIKDEDLLMKVAKAEWKLHQGKEKDKKDKKKEKV
ncbi:rab-GTPase-TBC domain-containing protein [Apodospora peruviana]|uniref:Rab-GTPase-TBC domain-containing protein n=1 Tax=Apodospora peruviana TaxID=516989 RepID=A0AAE0M0W4_9PEZI|nr:rab-GTPase-TBC domain-containing protein [Apodospora peruviana]